MPEKAAVEKSDVAPQDRGAVGELAGERPAATAQIAVVVAAAHVDAERERRVGRLLIGRGAGAEVQDLVLLVALLDVDQHGDGLRRGPVERPVVLAGERDGRGVVEELEKSDVALASLDRRGAQVVAGAAGGSAAGWCAAWVTKLPRTKTGPTRMRGPSVTAQASVTSFPLRLTSGVTVADG